MYDVDYPTFHGLSDGADSVMHCYTYPESKKKNNCQNSYSNSISVHTDFHAYIRS